MDIQFSTNHLTSAQTQGDTTLLKATNARHIQGEQPSRAQEQPSFGQMLFDALHGVNDEQHYAHNINIQAVSDPDSVEAHDVTIAMAKANLSLNITKNVLDRVVQAYREITTLR